VIVAALGYFVDIYDLILFSIVRVSSLKALGVEGQALFDQGVRLLNLQMMGMLLGGVLWGVLGDKRGRLSVLFGSILMYSVANLLNGFVQNVEQYGWLRFVAGIGLAGELGAGITLVSEVLPTAKRGYGTTLVAAVGISGAILAANVAEVFDWRTAYLIGGGLGLALLFLRVSVFESHLFSQAKEQVQNRGNFFALFSSALRFRRYLACIFIGVPIWFVIGILITFSPEFAREQGLAEAVSPGRAVMFAYSGLAMGDLASGLVSQLLRSRRRVVLAFLGMTAVFVGWYLFGGFASAAALYALCLALGFGAGYWAVFVTIGAEQFGTNLRATVTTSVPNFVRGSVVPLTLAFTALKGSMGMIGAAAMVGFFSLVASLVALWSLEETFAKDLSYFEEL
jgi:predicted MFS family arabinose efflux permease